MKAMLMGLLGGDYDAIDDWLKMASAGDDDVDEGSEGDVPEPAF